MVLSCSGTLTRSSSLSGALPGRSNSADRMPASAAASASVHTRLMLRKARGSAPAGMSVRNRIFAGASSSDAAILRYDSASRLGPVVVS